MIVAPIAARRLRVDAVLVERDQPRAEREGLLDIVGDHDDGHAAVAPERHDQLVHLRARAGIERAERLVEQQHRGFRAIAWAMREALLHAAGERARIFVAVRR